MTPDIAFYETFLEEQEHIQQRLDPSLNAVYFKETIQESNSKDLPARVISIRTQSEIPADWKENIDAVLTRSQGYDHLHRMFITCAKSIVLGYLGPYCARAVAEHAVTVMLMLLKKMKVQMQQFQQFKRDGMTGGETIGRKVLIFGVGHIGSDIARLCQAWGMSVKGVDIDPKWDGVEYVALDDGLAWAEIVFCAAPLTDKTEGLFNYERLQNTAQPRLFINISRGEISPLDDLKLLLEDGRVAGIGLDVYPAEQALGEKMRQGVYNDPDVQLLINFAEHQRVICTPHNAFNTVEGLARKSDRTVEAITDYFSHGRFPYPVPRRA